MGDAFPSAPLLAPPSTPPSYPPAVGSNGSAQTRDVRAEEGGQGIFGGRAQPESIRDTPPPLAFASQSAAVGSNIPAPTRRVRVEEGEEIDEETGLLRRKRGRNEKNKRSWRSCMRICCQRTLRLSLFTILLLTVILGVTITDKWNQRKPPPRQPSR